MHTGCIAAGRTGPIPRQLMELAELIDPAAGSPTLALLRRGGSEQLGDRLREMAATLRDRERRIVFAGHFSCGKSTLINALVRRDILPTGDLPETGVPCIVQSAPVDRIHCYSAGRRAVLPFGTDSIGHVVSLIDQSGDYRDAVQEVQKVVVGLKGNVPPPGVLWIDSPGINDTDTITRRAAQAATDADALVWVVNSRQPISQVEQAFLRDYVEFHGAESLAFVVNVFLPAQDRAAWTSFVRRRASYLAGRIADTGVCGTAAPPVVLVCARAAASHPDDFGAPQVRALLTGLQSVDGPSGRYRRVARQLDVLLADLAMLGAEEHARVDRLHAAQEQGLRLEREHHDRFRQAVDSWLPSAFARHEAMVEQCTGQVLHELANYRLYDDDRYGALLTQGIAGIAGNLGEEVIVQVDRIAAACGMTPLTDAAIGRLRSILRPAPLVVRVPSRPASFGRKGVGAVLGGLLGTLVGPGPGSAVGAALGAGIGAAADTTAAADSRAGAMANAQAAGWEGAMWLHAQQPLVQQLVMSVASPPPMLLPTVDTRRVEALDELRERLAAAVETLRRLTSPIQEAS